MQISSGLIIQARNYNGFLFVMIRLCAQTSTYAVIYAQLFEKSLFYLALIVFLVGGFLRASFLDFSDFDYGIYSDHFINAVTAKNITLGLHWSSSGYETYLLNPENLTIGPTIVLPVVFTVSAFGNGLILPGITVFLLNVFLLILVLISLKNSMANERQFFLSGFLLIILFVFFKSYYWYRMIGEISAILLLMLVIIFLTQYLQSLHFKMLFFAAIAGAFAMGTKELILLPLLLLAFMVACISCLRHNNKKWQICLGRPLLFLLIAFIVPLIFYLYRYSLLQIQTEQWRTAYFAYANGIHDYYSGVNTLVEYFASPAQVFSIFQRVLKSTLWNGGTLLHLSFVGMRGLQYWLCIFAALMAYIIINRKFSTLYALFAISALPLLLWFFFVSEKAMPRHLYMGLCLAAISVLFYIASVENIILRYTLAAISVLTIVLTGDQSSRFALTSWPTTISPYAVAINDMQNFIKTQPKKSLAWIGMISANEFEYLSHKPNNFINGFDLIVDSIEFDETAYLSSHPQVKKLIENKQYHSAFDFYISPENTQRESVKVNLIKPLDFNWLHFKNDTSRLHHSNADSSEGELCKNILYQNEYYAIERCSNEDIRTFFEKVGGLPVRPRKWRPYIMLPTERTELF